MNSSTIRRLAGLFGLLGVGLGAFGAHALKGLLEANHTTEPWEKAVHYHLLHAVVLLCLGLRPPTAPLAAWLFSGGILLFSGSLYLYSLAPVPLHAAVYFTPVGGLLLLGGWLAVLFAKE